MIVDLNCRECTRFVNYSVNAVASASFYNLYVKIIFSATLAESLVHKARVDRIERAGIGAEFRS
jgi:hypothetical protein